MMTDLPHVLNQNKNNSKKTFTIFLNETYFYYKTKHLYQIRRTMKKKRVRTREPIGSGGKKKEKLIKVQKLKRIRRFHLKNPQRNNKIKYV